LAGHTARVWRGGIHVGYWWKNKKEKDYKEGLHIGEKTIIRMMLRKIGWGAMGWIDLLQVRNQ
jgi:hypothetical protein